MKYSGLMPIRSTIEAYAPFSGLGKRIQHKRALSEVPPVLTSVMGIQCDSSELLGIFPDKLSQSPEQVKTLPKTQAGSPFTNPAISRIYELDQEPETFVENENLNGFGRKRVEFGKVGDWNETYVLKNKNFSGYRIYDRKVYTSKGVAKKTCKIVEFTPNLSNCFSKGNAGSLWQFNSSEKGIFQIKGSLRLQKRFNTANSKH
jgi:hypothetical protein